ncbi:MAG TPA: Rieske 2Fe-2S domain-containing protein [Nitrososphaeraceae archaeon]|nr:Rieske 2Fe-2S domain-containing protein [Nitrososphaeraceae archaeon]
MSFVKVLEETDLPANSSKLAYLNGKPLVLFNFNGKITALGNVCLHKGGPLNEGEVEIKYDGEYYVTCPWHGWEYNVTTGKAPPGYDDQQALYDVIVRDGKILVSSMPKIMPVRAEHKNNPIQDLVDLQYQTSSSSLNILGISTSNSNAELPRISTSELALEKALGYAKEKYNASTVMLRLRDLEFRHCEGYYSRNELACTWPCSISEMDTSDGMNEVYRKMILWSDVLFVSTPIRWGNASSLYYKMAERLNCVQNQITLRDRILIKNKVASFIITGGQDNIQQVAGQLMVFFTELGFALPPFGFMGWSRGWIAEDMEHNVKQFLKSRYISRSVKDLVDNCIKLSRQIKNDPCVRMESPQPKITESPSKVGERQM